MDEETTNPEGENGAVDQSEAKASASLAADEQSEASKGEAEIPAEQVEGELGGEAVAEDPPDERVLDEPAGEGEDSEAAEDTLAEEQAPEPEPIPDLKRLIGRKVGMTQIFDDTGRAIPVTLIEAGPCYITQIRTQSKDGYTAVQLGFGEIGPRRLTGGQIGHLKRNDLPAVRHLREFRLKNRGDLQEGEKVTVAVFEVGDRVDIVGTSKGRGFAGGIKRHGFHRGPKTHGQSDRERAPGSHGATSTPGRVFKGSRGPGHMGNVRVSSQNLRVDLVDPEHNLMGVRGSVPGPKGGLVLVKEGRKQ